MSALRGRRVLITRERPGELATLLEANGAVVVHVPLIEIVEPDDGGAALRAALHRLADVDWLVVTSAPGAERVADAARASPNVRLAAVGTTTARILGERAGRVVEVVPDVQHADSLADALIAAAGPRTQRVLVAQADRAAPLLVERLRAAGHDVSDVTAYSTRLRRPDPAAVAGADALLLASGSAAQAWFDALGPTTPPVVVAIGPMTAAVAERLGLKVTAVAADHSLVGLLTALERTLSAPGVRVVPGTVRNSAPEAGTESADDV